MAVAAVNTSVKGRTTSADVRAVEDLSAARLEHEVPHVALAGVSGTLGAVKRDDVDAHLLRGQGVAHGDALHVAGARQGRSQA